MNDKIIDTHCFFIKCQRVESWFMHCQNYKSCQSCKGGNESKRAKSCKGGNESKRGKSCKGGNESKRGKGGKTVNIQSE